MLTAEQGYCLCREVLVGLQAVSERPSDVDMLKRENGLLTFREAILRSESGG